MNFQGRRYLIADRDGAWAWMSAGSIVFGLNVIVMYLSIYSSNCKAKQQYFQRNSIVNMKDTVFVPAFEFSFDLVLCPLPKGVTDVSFFKFNSIFWLINCL